MVTKKPEDTDNPQPTGERDVFEDGLVPVQQPEPPEVVEAQARLESVQRRGNDAIAAATTSKILEEVTGALGADHVLTTEDVQKILQKALAAQNAELEGLRSEIAQVKAGQGASADGMINENASVGGYPWMCWRKPSTWPDKATRGWISIGPGGATPKGNRDTGSYSHYLKKGMIPVTKYGFIDIPKSPNAVEAFLPILAKGAAREFPASQVIAFEWHLRPPIKGLVFPQYEVVKDSIKSFICEACGKQQFFMPDDEEIGNAYRSHLMGPHKYPFREAAEAVKSQGFNLAPFRPATGTETALAQSV